MNDRPIPEEGWCGICGAWVTDREPYVEVGPGWIAHTLHPDDPVRVPLSDPAWTALHDMFTRRPSEASE